ncbi:hypothetical protein FHS15_002556 [Paenibacillus castaneae]|uniref:alpha/beta hydrolase family protein n=1 Tax=Paenibacillus castaneae TaxID=474957 RepID=UPI000C9CBA89|nr:alpha/beta hydrolase [Paenibacillus castaneae]NIK77420.1 hypothetical protein [Paenibacillus castaneae]
MELVLQEPKTPYQGQSKFHRMKTWIAGKYRTRNSLDSYVWRISTGSTALFGSLSMLVAVFGMPTGFGTIVDIILFLTINAVAMGLSVILLSFILNLLYLPLPRRFIAACLYVGIETYLILYFAELGIMMSIIISVAFTLLGALAGILLGLLLRLKLKPRFKAITAIVIASIIAVGLETTDWPGPATMPQREGVQDELTNGSVEPLLAANPSEKGSIAYQTFTYGSGRDKHRSLFGNEVDIKTEAVDASAYITEWSWLKTRFWGFDEHALPLNGRVWMPEGDGPFPVALIVHGNHLMESFSDGGYGYLGELLASKGIITISVDENFLNYSVWSGIPNHDMKVRAWILLKHLQQIQQLDEENDNPFSGRVDFSKIALIGHSRGGQAVAMAADADRWFKEDKTLASLSQMHIESVIAIAPTDKQVDDKLAKLTNVNYLTLQGARDADVNNFYGERQYARTTFKEQAGKFKAALYIADANHSQFNSDWGRMDERPPGGLFLNRNGLLQPEEQRQISKVYVSAFLQATLLGEEDYTGLFKDYRRGLDWLPNTVYTNRFEASEFTAVARYDDTSQKTVIKDGGKAVAEGMTDWEVAFAEDRDGQNKGTKGIVLEWSEPGAQYELQLSPKTNDRMEGMLEGNLVFSMANLERDLTKTAEEETTPPADIETEMPPLPNVEIELTTTSGENRIIGLANIMAVQPPAYTAFMSLSWLEDRVKEEKYKESSEPVFQTYVIPIEQFGPDDPQLSIDEISRITFRFVNGPGKVMLDDIGFMP